MSVCRCIRCFSRYYPVAREIAADKFITVHKRDSPYARNDLLQQCDHLAESRWLNIGEASNVAAWVRKRRYKTGGQRVVDADKYDRNSLGLAADRINSRTGAGIDDVWLERDALLCSRLQCRGPITLDGCITALTLNGFYITPSKLHED